MTWVANSSIKGYIGPTSTTALDDNSLDDIIHDLIQGLTNLDNTLIRPGFQPQPANMPNINQSWIAFQLVKNTDDLAPSYSFDPLIGLTEYKNEIMEYLISSYGPNAGYNLRLIRDGIKIGQNRDVLSSLGMAFISLSETMQAPMKINERWEKRYDVRLRLRREISVVYPIESLQSAEIELNRDDNSTTENIFVTQ